MLPNHKVHINCKSNYQNFVCRAQIVQLNGNLIKKTSYWQFLAQSVVLMLNEIHESYLFINGYCGYSHGQ